MQAQLRCLDNPSKVFEIADFSGSADVLLGIPCFTRPIQSSWMRAVQRLQYPTGMTFGVIAEQGKNPTIDSIKGDYTRIGPVRDKLVLRALTAKAQYLLFLDDDVEPPADMPVRLIEVLQSSVNAKVCGAIYPRKGDDFYPVLWSLDGEDIESWSPPWGVFECGAVGAGCMMIDMSIFSVIPYPRFQPSVGPNDDVLFCQKVRQAGYTVWAHGGVRCGHWAGFRKYIWS